jgi:D-3-phosphoglycerate dehydrogenase / 2-oxoglutarate reductase
MSYKILVPEGITSRGAEILRAEGWQVDIHQKPAPPEELAKMVPPYHALLIRSGSKVTADVIEAAANMKVIGRPGVGVDNVDIPAATRRGIMVMNSPQGNMVSTAELTMALMLALARNIAAAGASMKSETWDRKSFAGVELQKKRVGIVGLGRIGREVAQRCRAFNMEVVGYDPFVSPQALEALHVTLVSLDELFATCDYMSLHTTLTDDTRQLVNRERLAKCKPGLRIVNAARGKLIDDEALLEALDSGKVAGAALDVHTNEPPKDWRLAKHPKVVATPHLGAQTKEAQERVGTDIAVQVRDFLKSGVIQQAVNFFSLTGDLNDQMRPAMLLAERLGSLVGQLTTAMPQRIELNLYGELAELDAKPLLAAAATGVLKPLLKQSVTIINAVALAKENGIATAESSSTTPVAYSNLMEIRVQGPDQQHSVAATLFGGNHQRMVELDGVEIDAIPQGHLLLVRNDDTPGVVGAIGTHLGKRAINIARMTVGRQSGSGALMLIEVDAEVPKDVVREVAGITGVREARALHLG